MEFKNNNLIENNHSHCKIILNDKNNNLSKNIIFKEKIIFIPIILTKILLSFYLYEKYFCYSLGKHFDIIYSQNIVFYFIIYLIILYLMTILYSPAQTNIDKYIKFKKSNNFKKELIKFRTNYITCNYCLSPKFIRSSHCRICNKCISFRDHHCSFINNCVGFNNMQYFLNFCFWGAYAIIFDITSFCYFKYINLSITIKTILYVDFIGNIFFLIILLGIITRSIFNIYNNRTYLEVIKQIGIEIKCIIFDCFKEKNKYKINNFLNIGFLNHLFYLIGPTLLHFFLPLPKFKNYVLDENCPIFINAKMPNNLQLIKYKLKNAPDYIKMKINNESNPDDFIKISHIYYDKKIIV